MFRVTMAWGAAALFILLMLLASSRLYKLNSIPDQTTIPTQVTWDCMGTPPNPGVPDPDPWD